MREVDRKTARDSYVAGKTVTILESKETENARDIIVEIACTRPIKDSSKVRRFNKIVSIFTSEYGMPRFVLDAIGG